MGCYVDEKGNQKDACVISRDYNKADHYYIFNHVDITVTYHNGKSEDWGKYFGEIETQDPTAPNILGRIVSVKLVPRSIDHSKFTIKDNDCGNSLQSGIPLAIPAKNSGKVAVSYSYTVSYKVRTHFTLFFFSIIN